MAKIDELRKAAATEHEDRRAAVALAQKMAESLRQYLGAQPEDIEFIWLADQGGDLKKGYRAQASAVTPPVYFGQGGNYIAIGVRLNPERTAGVLCQFRQEGTGYRVSVTPINAERPDSSSPIWIENVGDLSALNQEIERQLKKQLGQITSGGDFNPATDMGMGGGMKFPKF